MTTIYLVRHAESDLTVHEDVIRPLTQKGLADAKKLAHVFADIPVDIVLSSPYKRAVDTVKPLADLRGLAIGLVDDFRERRIDSGWIEDFVAFARMQWEDFSYRRSDGESLAEVQERNVRALMQTVVAYSGKTVVIGSHGTALSTMVHWFDPSFGFDRFEAIRKVTPLVVRLTFQGGGISDITWHPIRI